MNSPASGGPPPGQHVSPPQTQVYHQTVVLPAPPTTPSLLLYQPAFPLSEADYLRLTQASPFFAAVGGVFVSFGLSYVPRIVVKGDPDMTADELQAAIDRAEQKRREFEAQQPAAQGSAKVLSILPKSAELYRRQIAEGLDGDPRAALKARVFLREWFGGKIRLEPLPDAGLMAHWNQNVGALCKDLGSCGSGGRI